MGGGHGHDGGHGTGHGDDHGHGAGPATATHDGPHEIPPMPEHPMISPARADYEAPWPGRLMLWPVLWLVVGVLFFVAARRWDHPPIQGEGHGEPGHEAPAGHGEPASPHEPAGEPAMAEHPPR